MRCFVPIALVAAGCIIDSNQTSNGSNLIVTWSFEALATQTPASCPTGFDTAAVSSQEIDPASGSNIGSAILDLFTCGDGAGTTSSLTGDTYVETVAIMTDQGDATYGTTLPVVADISTQEVDTPPLYIDGGYFRLAWLVAVNGGSAASCLDIPDAYGYSVQIVATGGAGPLASPGIACGLGGGVTTGYVDGTYDVTAAFLGPDGTPYGSSAPVAGNISTNATQGNTVSDLGTVTIPVTLPSE